MTALPYSDPDKARALQTLESIKDTIAQLIEWNTNIVSIDFYYSSQQGMQLLAANCTLITAIGEGVNRVNRILPEFLQTKFPDVAWRAIIGMRNHIAHGYFELDAEMIFEAIKDDIPPLKDTIIKAIDILR